MLKEFRDTSHYFDRLQQKYREGGMVSAARFEATSTFQTLPTYVLGILDHIWTYFKIAAGPCGPEDTESFHSLHVRSRNRRRSRLDVFLGN